MTDLQMENKLLRDRIKELEHELKTVRRKLYIETYGYMTTFHACRGWDGLSERCECEGRSYWWDNESDDIFCFNTGD